ncbi:MAG: SLC13 family permease [Anaerolineales bacterium]
MIAVTFFLSMLVTNDVALIVIVPLTLTLDINRKDILVILEALAANAGSALTPFGNPQNLFIYWFYNINAEAFITAIAPFSLVFLILLVLASLLIRTSNNKVLPVEAAKIKYSVFIYGALLLTVILAVLHVLPVQAEFIVIIYAVIFDRNSLRIDYALLLTFACFFGLAENIQGIFAANVEHSGHIFIFSALLSQAISNVPATLLLIYMRT